MTTVKKLTIGDDDKVEPKIGAELLSVDVNNKKRTMKKRLDFVGQEANKLFRSLVLDPMFTQLSTFYEKVYIFHRTVATRLMKYFETGL